MERTIKVTGKGNVSIKPDRIRLLMTMKGTMPDYSSAVERSAEQTGQVRESVKSAGLDPKALKTTSFDINTEYEDYKDRKDNWKRKFVGYRFTHHTYIEFENDNKVLGKVLYALTQCPVNVEFRIVHTVSDPERAKADLLKDAVDVAMSKAETLTQAAGVQLGQIISIDHSWNEIDIYANDMTLGMDRVGMVCEKGMLDIDIEADDISLSDTVTIVWEII